MYDLVALLRERGAELWRQTVTDAQMRHTLQKTMFRFNPKSGSIEVEQKLPFPLIILDETQLFHELPEIQKVCSLLSMFKSSNTSTMDLVFSYLPRQQQLSTVQYVSSREKPYASVLQLIIGDVQWDLNLANRTVRANGISQMLPSFGSSTKRDTAAFFTKMGNLS
ncbi:hypothetical protein DAPPUDRAFT_263510 [Daphnia pulex]|uniref:Uncharacterized protein n=1 Tax=Daphnia pulex TaxID=6669 RepID=E9HPW3_DAPPU|nr:hypothetical protein DAPPUDRAFT_263510 [Daphnia pulex]|eukprot:EFX66229.1 hypothetical protein DAPPUDRAFT_263510 [Daphnia pulex]